MNKADAMTGHRSNVEEMAEGVTETVHQLERDLPTDADIAALEADSLTELTEAAEGIGKALSAIQSLVENAESLVEDRREVADICREGQAEDA